MNRVFVLMGLKHCGKSTVGSILAEKLYMPFYDCDDEIRRISGKTARQWYDEGGEKLFMQKEREACESLAAAARHSGAVIASGGGICDNEAALEVLRLGNALFVLIDVPESVIFDRVTESALRDKRWPSYIQNKNPATKEDAARIFHEVFYARYAKYRALCPFSVSGVSGGNTALSPDQIAEKIKQIALPH